MKLHSKDLIPYFTLPLWNQQKLELIDRCIAPNALINTTFQSGMGPQVLKEAYSKTFEALSSISFETFELITTNERVIYRWQCQATHSQDLFGFKPTQLPITFEGITVIQLNENQITEFLSFTDLLRILLNPSARLTDKTLPHHIIKTIYELTGVKMTKREIECLELWLKGFSIKQTARLLGGLSTRTIQTFRENIKRKLNVNSYQKLLALVHNMGLLSALLRY